jgi:hydrogenase maturation protein HypF
VPPPSLDLLPHVAALADETDAGRGAAVFHLVLAQGLVQAALQAADAAGARSVALGGGCFFNRLLSREVTAGLQAAGVSVLRPQHGGCGDAGLALGQAWVAALRVRPRRPEPCALPCRPAWSNCWAPTRRASTWAA